MNLLPSALVLTLAAAAALFLSLSRRSPPDSRKERRAASSFLGVAVAVQGLHFLEEAATGLPERLGPLLGVEGMPFSGFVVFNMAWIAVWVASVPGVRLARRGAFFAAWFLAIAGMLNGVLHPLLAMAARGYFPGLLTAPAIGIAGLRLGLLLRGATRAVGDRRVQGVRPADGSSRGPHPGRHHASGSSDFVGHPQGRQ